MKQSPHSSAESRPRVIVAIPAYNVERFIGRGAVIKEVPVYCHYTPSTLNLKAIKHGLGVALAVVKIRLQSLFKSRSSRSY